MTEKTTKNHSFQAEVSKLLDLVANSLYSEREIFLRELISNSADACEKLRYQSLSKKNILGDDVDLKINVRVSKKKKYIEIQDNGIGMTEQELIDNLGTIARSGTSKFMEAMKNKKETENDKQKESTRVGIKYFFIYGDGATKLKMLDFGTPLVSNRTKESIWLKSV